jgi:putative nucleotidyltransferase with HDIG domain
MKFWSPCPCFALFLHRELVDYETEAQQTGTAARRTGKKGARPEPMTHTTTTNHWTLPEPPPSRTDIPVPDEEQCLALWDRFEMLDNIRRHSTCVADVATFLAQKAKDQGHDVDVQLVRASALLHDIAKTYAILHGGNHSQLGGAWMQEVTGNPVLSSGVTHHVYWPFAIDLENHFPQLAVLYADKRVRHDTVVSIADRFEDLIERYGSTEYIRRRIQATMDQALEVETAFTRFIKVDLNEHTFDCGRME